MPSTYALYLAGMGASGWIDDEVTVRWISVCVSAQSFARGIPRASPAEEMEIPGAIATSARDSCMTFFYPWSHRRRRRRMLLWADSHESFTNGVGQC